MSGNEKTIKRTLFEKLRKYHNDKDFVGGVMSNVNYDEDRQIIIDFIDNDEDVSVENIILLSLHLSNKRTEAS
ncbi:MAG: hypothetical protein UF228_06680 [Lachnospiraceae bacterium]|nr:hypothetical protein [Lachnospiraceae bacterium]